MASTKEVALQKSVRSLVDLPALRDQLSLVIPNGDTNKYVPRAPTQEGVDEIMQACRDALHFSEKRKSHAKSKTR